MGTPASNAAVAAAHTTRERVWGVVWRSALVLVSGYFAADIIREAVQSGGNTKINIATSGVAASVLVAFFADLVGLWSGCKAYIRGTLESLHSLTANFWKAWVSITAILLSIFAWSGPAGPDPWFIVYTNQAAPAPTETRRVAAIPALFINDATADWKQGVAFNAAELDVSLKAFERIFAAFRACGSAPNKPPVELTITGYASSRKFDDMSDEKSNLFNVETANRRAWNAYCFAASRVPANLVNASEWPQSKWSCSDALDVPAEPRAPVKLHVTYWQPDQSGFQAMMRARPIQDWPHEILAQEREHSEELDRRVDFYLNHAGACQVDSAREAPVTVAAATG